ncbi:MAG TPA: CRISPR system precrRNA processing endoribonuclease RAMP protein Cas6 [Pseudogracilibacillus sp.]|nr:CRISPR system precrRNA processing endoribonuclease RAMP protein Cas6 [Pseudogracilibacillus sp.]
MMHSISLQTLQLQTTFEAKEDGMLPAYLGSTLRGVLGHAMRHPVCIKPNERCHLCSYAKSCNYANFFNSPGNVAGAVNPYVLHVPVRDKVHWKKGDLCTFDITIFGEATAAANYYLSGIINMGNYGWGVNRLQFKPVHMINKMDQTIVWKNEQTWENNLKAYPLEVNHRTALGIYIHFVSPTRILVKRKLQRRLSFYTIVQSILRRIQLISQAYAQQVNAWDEDLLLEKAKAVEVVEEDWQYVDFKRYSKTYNRKLQLPAIEGYAQFSGDITPFIPLLELGKTFHIGKNSTHGFGRYELYYV